MSQQIPIKKFMFSKVPKKLPLNWYFSGIIFYFPRTPVFQNTPNGCFYKSRSKYLILLKGYQGSNYRLP